MDATDAKPVESPEPLPEIAIRQISNQVLMAAAAGAAPEIDKVTGWVAAGLGALLAFLLPNMDKTAGFVNAGSFKRAAGAYLVLVVLHAVQRTLTTIVHARAAAASKAIDGMKLLADQTGTLPLRPQDGSRLLERLETGHIWGFKQLIARQISKVREGDLDFLGRSSMVMVQIAAYLAAVQAVFALAAIALLLRAPA